MTTGLAARQVWFNSSFHRDSFCAGLRDLLKRMPDHQPMHAVERILDKSAIHPPGIESFPDTSPRTSGPLRILWVARWEFDKGPETFFEALMALQRQRVEFRLSMLGERFRQTPAVFDEARARFNDRIDNWGYLSSRDEYRHALSSADVVVSTARHEFFGIGIVEAVAAGAFPLVPDRLSYPEVLCKETNGDFFYEGSAAVLAGRLSELATRVAADDLWQGDRRRGIRCVSRFCWPELAPAMDDALEAVARYEPVI